MYAVRCTMYAVRCTLYDVRCTMYDVRCTLYTVRCTMYDVRCTLYSVHSVDYYVNIKQQYNAADVTVTVPRVHNCTQYDARLFIDNHLYICVSICFIFVYFPQEYGARRALHVTLYCITCVFPGIRYAKYCSVL